MPVMDTFIIMPLISSLIIILCYLYYLNLEHKKKVLKMLKFRTKLLKQSKDLEKALSNYNKLKDIVYFDIETKKSK